MRIAICDDEKSAEIKFMILRLIMLKNVKILK